MRRRCGVEHRNFCCQKTLKVNERHRARFELRPNTSTKQGTEILKVLFIIMLVLNLLTEVMAATALIGGPEGISAAGKGEMWSMHYGFAVLAIASASLWIWPYRTDIKAVTAVLGVLMTFHAVLFLSLTLAGDQAAGMIIHAFLATLCMLLLTQRSRWCSE